MSQMLPTKTIPEIKAAAYVAMATMLVIMAAGLKTAWFTPPHIITNKETVVLPNGNAITMQQEIIRLKAEVSEWHTVADTRAVMIFTISRPMQGLTDSLLRLQRVMIGIAEDNKSLLTSGEAARQVRYATLIKEIREAGATPDIRALLDEQTLVLSGLLMQHDTFYSRPPRLKFLKRVGEVFRPSER